MALNALGSRRTAPVGEEAVSGQAGPQHQQAKTASGADAHPRLILPRGRIMKLLGLSVAVLFLLSLAGQIARYHLGYPTVLGLVDLFYLDEENSVPTWYQSAVFLLAGGLLSIIGLGARSSGAPFASHWLVLATICVGLSLDEVASLHERTIDPIYFSLRPTGIWSPSWVILGMAAVASVALLYLRFFLHLSRADQLQIAAAAIIFVGGSIGVEMMTAAMFDTADVTWKKSFDYVLMVQVEEGLEMVGLLIFVDFLLRRASQTGPIRLAVTDDRAAPTRG